MDNRLLKEIVKENIEWFWNNDPIVDSNANDFDVWEAFRAWCVQNLMELGVSKRTAEKETNKGYCFWRAYNE